MSQRDCYVNCPISRDSAELSCGMGRFERASTLHPGSSGGDWIWTYGLCAEAHPNVAIEAAAVEYWNMRSATGPNPAVNGIRAFVVTFKSRPASVALIRGNIYYFSTDRATSNGEDANNDKKRAGHEIR